jgi:predicted nucleic acid-binding Zn ribbon protein
MKDDPLKKCPKCKAMKLKRRIGKGAGIIFKGSGFYCTDYRSPSYDKAAKSESGSSSTPAGGSKSESKSESKPSTDSSSPNSPEKKTTESAKKAS